MTQYVLLALCIRLPVTTAFKQSTLTNLAVILIFLLLINTVIGTIWFFELTDLEKRKAHENKFELKDEYLAHGIIMILIPWSIFFFLVIVLVKFLCFFFTDGRRRGSRYNRRRMSYGEFVEEEKSDTDTDAVVSVYLNSMEKVKFAKSDGAVNETENSEAVAEQLQCRLCLLNFKPEDEILKFPICEHIFHSHCLKNWLIAFQKCPVCDRNIILMPKNSSDPALHQSQKLEMKAVPGLIEMESVNEGRNMLV